MAKQDKKNPQAKNKKGIKKSEAPAWQFWSAIAFILLVSFIAYSPALHNGFVWDDDDYIRNNDLIRSFNLKAIFSGFLMGNYHPLTVLVFAIEYHLFGLTETGFHAFNILLHALNSLLVFFALFRLTQKLPVAFIASLLFAVHPLHVESVAWVSELKDLLYTFFFLLSLIFYLRYNSTNNKKNYTLSILFFLCSMLSKAMAASFPLVLLLVDYYNGKKINAKVLIEKIPYFLIAFILGVVAVFAQKETGATDITVFPFFQRVVFACYGFIAYITKIILPLDLSAYYAYPVKPGQALPSQYFLYVLLCIMIIGAVIYSLRFTKKIFFAFAFFAITVFLVLQLLPVGGAVMADRYGYVPSIGIFFLIAEGFYLLWQRKNLSSLRYPAIAVLCAGVIFYSSKTYARCEIWKNGMTLWNNVISQYQTIPQAYINRGVLLAKENKDTEAMNDYNKAIEIEPRFDKAYNDRGILLAKYKKYDEALKDYNKAIELNKDYANVYNNRGVLYKIQNDFEEAIKNYDRAIQLKPNYLDAIYNRGVALRNVSRYEESQRDFAKVLQLQPDYVNAYTARGVLYMNQQKYDQALNDFNKAIQIKPGFAQAYANRGNLYKQLKNNDEAIRDYSTAVQIEPRMGEAFYYRGTLLYDKGDKANGCADLKQAASFGLQVAVEEFNRLCK